MPNEIISNGKKYSGNYPTNLAENVVSFESADETNPTSFQEMPQLATPGRMKTLMHNLSIAYKNLRYLVKLFGTTDISAIGDGTVSGILKNINGISYGHIPSLNANDIYSPGIYEMYSSDVENSINFAAKESCILEVIKCNIYTIQRQTGVSASYVRFYSSGNWRPWVTIS